MKSLILKDINSKILYIFLFVFLLIQTFIYNTIDMDYWARLLQGNAFWSLGYILKNDPFSYTGTHLWLDHEWGASVIFSFIHNNLGFYGILLFKTFFVFLLFFFIYKTILLRVKNINNLFILLLFIIASYALPTIVHSCLRCHFFTFLFFSIFIYILEIVRLNKNYKLLFFLPLIMMFWCNIHGGCVAGLGLIFIYTIGELLNKRIFKFYLLAFFLSLCVLFINPYGFEYVKFIFMASTMSRPFVTEWISPFLHPNLAFLVEFKVFYIVSLLYLLFSFKKYKTDYTKYILLFVCAFISFKSVKNTPFFIIVSLIFLFIDIFELEIKNFNLYILITILIFFSYGIYGLLYCRYHFLSQQPVKVVDFIDINNLKGNILCPFDMGSYVYYKLYPNNLVYMDGRYEEVYFDEQKKNVDKFYNASDDYDDILKEKIPPDYIIIPTDALVNDYMWENKQYQMIYQDENETLYSSVSKLKKVYTLPSRNYYDYSLKEAFKTKFKFTDEVMINGKKVIFE